MESSASDRILLGDRLCVRCGSNLWGQPIVREPRYELLIVRCPDCGQVAPVEEFPPLDRWVARWTMLAAALWLLFLTALSAGSIVFLVVTTTAITAEATDRSDSVYREAFETWYADRNPDGERSSARDPDLFAQFWAESGETVLETHPPMDAVEWAEMPLLLVPGLFALAFGGVWSLALLHRRRAAIVIAAAVVAAIILLLLGLLWWLVAQVPVSSADQVTWVHLRFPLLVVVLPCIILLFILGVVLGRPIARGLVRAFLPPRFRGALAFLWTVDGRAAPRGAPVETVSPEGPS